MHVLVYFNSFSRTHTHTHTYTHILNGSNTLAVSGAATVAVYLNSKCMYVSACMHVLVYFNSFSHMHTHAHTHIHTIKLTEIQYWPLSGACIGICKQTYHIMHAYIIFCWKLLSKFIDESYGFVLEVRRSINNISCD